MKVPFPIPPGICARAVVPKQRNTDTKAAKTKLSLFINLPFQRPMSWRHASIGASSAVPPESLLTRMPENARGLKSPSGGRGSCHDTCANRQGELGNGDLRGDCSR